MRRVIRMKAVRDGRVVKVEASVSQASYHPRIDQNFFHQRVADELYEALRQAGFHSLQIQIGK